MLVHDFLRNAARRSPDSVALIEPGRVASYADLERRSNRASWALRSAGVRRGDRVALALEDGIEFAESYFGVMKAGAVAVPLPPGPYNQRLATALSDCAPAAAVISRPTAQDHAAAEALARVPVVFVNEARPASAPDPAAGRRNWQLALDEAPDDDFPVRMIDLDLAAIIYTSGSTGEPRGVMLSHLNIRSNTESIVQYLSLTSADRVMCVLPFYYVYGLSLLHTHLCVGGSVIVDPRFAFPNLVLRSMQEHRATGFAGVPSTFALLLHRSTLRDTRLPELRYVTQAGGAMPPARIREWLVKGPPVPFYVMYGATEASARLTYLDPIDLERKLGSIGRAIPNVEIVVVRDDGVTAAPGEVGELVARGSNISRGYWNHASETAERFGPIGYRTGDLGYADEQGFLYLVGRRHDMLKVGAHRVAAKEIEDVLNEYPAIHEAAVVPIPHEILGEAPLAFVATLDGSQLDGADIVRFCRQRLAPHKVPVEFIPMDTLPKGLVGKVDKLALKRIAAQRQTSLGPDMPAWASGESGPRTSRDLR